MDSSSLTAISLAYVLLVSTVVGVPLVLGPGVAAAANHQPPQATYAVGQAGQCIPIRPIGDGSETGPEYYDYRNPETDPNSTTYSSFGTTDVQQSDVSQLYVYAGSDGDNLVVLHDMLDDGQNGGAVTFDVAGLPASGSWTVEDDDYSSQDDRFSHGETTSEMHWMWESDRTDGGVFNGLDGEDWTEITIDPAFRNESWAWTDRSPRWPYAREGPNEWVVRDGQGGKTSLDMSETVSIRKGACDAVETTADLRAPSTTEPGANVTLDASNSTSETAIVEYRWDLTNDGSIDRRTETAAIDHSYEAPGDVTAAVTVVDRFGNEVMATADIRVEETGEPRASLSVPANATVGTEVTLDASGSSDDGGIVDYRWSFGDGSPHANSSNATIAHVYDSPGQYTPTVTVIDDDGNTDTANATITIDEEDSPPTAALSAPDEVSPNETVTLDATNSSDEGTIVEYRWTVDGAPLDGANGSRTNVTFTEPGDHAVDVTVVDDAGNEATANATIYVLDETPPVASLSTPANATVGTEVTLDATGSFDDDTGIASYRWRFGDNSSETSTTSGTIGHTYDSPGTYSPQVTVVDRDGNTDTANATITVESATALAAAFSINASSPVVGQPIAVDASASTVESPNASYEWDFGDNSSGTGVTATHAYDAAGNFTVRLTVSDGGGNNDTATAGVAVTAGNESDGGSGSSGGGDTDDSNDGGNSDGDSGGGGSTRSSGGGSRSSGGSSGGTSGSSDDDENAAPSIVVQNVTVEGNGTRVGEPLPVNATVANEGDATGSETIDFSVDGRVVDTRELTLAGGESRQVTFTARIDDPGEHTLRVDSQSTSVTIEPGEPDLSVVDVRLEETTIQTGQQATVLVTVANAGSAAGRQTVRLRVFDEVVDRQTVAVPPGERRTVRFVQRFDSPGTYDLDVSGQQASVAVTGESTSAAFTLQEPDRIDRFVSVGYIGLGGLALAAAAIFASRRL